MTNLPARPSRSAPPELIDYDLDARVNHTVLRLNALCKKATFDFTIAVGRIIVNDFYGGDTLALRSRGPKAFSFRKLASHPDLPMSPASLYRSVAIYSLCERLGVLQWKHVSTSHLRLVLPLPPEEQARLLECTEAQAWSVQRLRQEIVSPTRNSDAATPRNARVKLHNTIRRLADSLDEFVGLTSTPAFDEASPESVNAILVTTRRLRESCISLEREVEEVCQVAIGSPHAHDPARPDRSG